jgi:hypothetical protein
MAQVRGLVEDPVTRKLPASKLPAGVPTSSDLAGKADTSTVNAALANKADTSAVTALGTTVAGKADAATVTALAGTVSGKADAATVTALSSTVAGKLAKPANPSAPAVPVIAADGTVTTTPLSGLGTGTGTGLTGGATADTWATATAYTAGRIVAVNGKTYFAKDDHTSGATFAGDLAAHWSLLGVADIAAAGGVLVDDAVELAADDTVIDLTNPPAGPAKAIPSTAVFAWPGDAIDSDGNGTFPVQLTDGREVTVHIVGLTLGLGGTAPTGVPGAPTGLTATPGELEVALSWTAPADPGDSAISDYRWEYRPGTSGSYTAFPHTASTATSGTITGLTANQPYQFRIEAINTQGTGAPSNVASATPTDVLSLNQHDDFERGGADADVIGTSPDGYDWNLVALPNRDADPSGATPSAGHVWGTRTVSGTSTVVAGGHLAVISQPAGGSYMAQRTAPSGSGWTAGFQLSSDNPQTNGIRHACLFVDDQNYMFLRSDRIYQRIAGVDTALGSTSFYGPVHGMTIEMDVKADRSQARLHIPAGANEGGSWPEFTGAWQNIPVALQGSNTVGVISDYVPAPLPRLVCANFTLAPNGL